MNFEYDYYIVAFSGGKDSVACVLKLIDEGVPLHKIELHHHCVDDDHFDILDLGYWSKQGHYAKPEHNWRLERDTMAAGGEL